MIRNPLKHIKPLAGIFSIILTIPLLFHDTTLSMAQVWQVNETFTHGYLIFPITLWLIWQTRQEIATMKLEPEPRVLLLLMLVLLGWFVAHTVDVQVVQQLAMITMIPLLIWMLFGRALFIKLLFPLFFLYFAVPLGQSLIPVMMEFTADFTVMLINLVGIPIYRDGLYFSLPSGNWSVVEECSGVRYLIASLSLGTIYAYLNYHSLRKRLMFIGFAIVVPIIANGLRAFGIVMLGHTSGMELAVGADHLLYGWVFFGIVIFIMFYIGSFWSDPLTKNLNDQQYPPGELNDQSSYKFLRLIVISLLLILGTRVYAYQMILIPEADAKNITLELPNSFLGWQQTNLFSTNWNPIYQAPDVVFKSNYHFGKDFVQLNIAHYTHQRQGTEAVSTQNRLTDPLNGAWKKIHSTDLQAPNLYVEESILRRGDLKLLVWKWYRIGEMLTPNTYIAKVFDAYNHIILRRQDAAMITITTPFENDPKLSRKLLQSFYNDASASIYNSIEDLRP